MIAGQKKVSPDRLVKGALWFGLAILAAAFMPTLALAVLALVLVGVFSIAFTSLGNSVLQLQSSPQMRGRVMSFWAIAFLGSSTIGGPVVGWFGEHVGSRWGLALGGLAAVSAAIFGWKTLGSMDAQLKTLDRRAGSPELVGRRSGGRSQVRPIYKH